MYSNGIEEEVSKTGSYIVKVGGGEGDGEGEGEGGGTILKGYVSVVGFV